MRANNLREGRSEGAETSEAAPRSTNADPNVVIDSDGRRLRLREPTLLEEQDALVAMGSHGENAAALRRALYALRVAEIDGEPVSPPRTTVLYRAMLQQVRHAGIVAVINHLTPQPEGAPVAEFDGEIGDYMMVPHEGGVAVFRIADRAALSEVDQAKN